MALTGGACAEGSLSQPVPGGVPSDDSLGLLSFLGEMKGFESAWTEAHSCSKSL